MLLQISIALGGLALINCVPSIEDETILRPSLMNPYFSHRKNCDWKITEKKSFDTCSGDRLECIVPTDGETGTGYISIVRYGPYTSRGGYQETHCVGSGHVPELGEWMVGGVLGAVDAYTGHYMGKA